MKKGHDKNKIFSLAGFAHIEILFVILAIAVLGISIFFVQRNSGSLVIPKTTSIAEATATPNPFVPSNQPGWKKYSNDRCDDLNGKSPFSIEIPDEWGLENSVTEEEASSQAYIFSSSDSSVDVSCGDGFGGGICDDLQGGKYIPVKIGHDIHQICLYESEDKYELGQILINDSNTTFAIRASTKSDADSIKTLNQILSTFQFTGPYEAH